MEHFTSRFNILGVSHQKHEPNYFHMIREKGQPAINFIHFTSPAAVILEGAAHMVEASACIIYTPGYPQDYMARGDYYKNDYITFQVDDGDFLARFGLPENEIFYINHGADITHRLEWISWAVADKTEPHGQDIDDAIMGLFAALAGSHIASDPHFNRMMATKQRFIALRDLMRKDPSPWNVPKMAQKVWLTRSRFSVLYNEFFGVSPNADLMAFKMDHAKQLLISTKAPVSDIAHQCGYKSVEHFTRNFTKMVGETPLQFRKSGQNEDTP